MLIFLVAAVLAISAATRYIGNFAHAIPDRNADFSIFVPEL